MRPLRGLNRCCQTKAEKRTSPTGALLWASPGSPSYVGVSFSPIGIACSTGWRRWIVGAPNTQMQLGGGLPEVSPLAYLGTRTRVKSTPLTWENQRFDRRKFITQECSTPLALLPWPAQQCTLSEYLNGEGACSAKDISALSRWHKMIADVPLF